MHELAQTKDLASFVAVVENGSFAGAARQLATAPSTLSRTIAKLEATLGANLLRRSTRSIALTAEGAEVLRIARGILESVDKLRDVGRMASTPRGPLRINAAVPFTIHVLAPRLPLFRELYPEIDVALTMTDTVVDLIGAHADVAIRLGILKSSEMLVRRLGSAQWRLTASPDYLKHVGVPKTVGDLKHLEQVRFLSSRHLNELRFKGEDAPVTLSASIEADNGEAVRHLVLNGMGIARFSDFMVDADIRSGRLVEILPDQLLEPPMAISAVYMEPAAESRRLEVFLNFLVDQLR